MQVVNRFSWYLVAQIVTILVAAAILPITTRVLGPTEYGIVALLSSITSIGTAIGGLGASLLFAKDYPVGDQSMRKQLVSTVFWITMATHVVAIGMILLLWQPLSVFWPATQAISWSNLLIALAAMLFAVPWISGIEIIVLDGKARNFAITTMLSSLLSASSTIISLYVLKLGVTSLFIGNLVAAVVLATGAFVVLYPYLRLHISLSWAWNNLKQVTFSAGGNLSDRLVDTFESYLLSTSVGLSTLGIYDHSKKYRAMMMQLSKVVGRTNHPTLLQESRIPDGHFPESFKLWSLWHIVVTLAGIFLATLGYPLVSLMTNGKFSQAADLTALWMVFVLVQALAQPGLGRLMSSESNSVIPQAQLVANVTSIILMALLIGPLGVYGLMLASVLGILIIRLVFWLSTGTLHLSFSFDLWAFVGIAFILTTTLITQALNHSFSESLIVMLVMMSAFLLIAKRRVAYLLGAARKIYLHTVSNKA